MSTSASVAPLSGPAAPRHPVAWGLLLALPGVMLLGVLVHFAINVPTGDDFFAILGFLERWQGRTGDLLASLRLLFLQFYSHRMPFTNLATIGDAVLLGHCDLRLISAVAWAGWFLLVASLLRAKWSEGPGRLWLLPAALVLLSPQGASTLLVATGSPGHPWTLLLAYWALRIADRAGTASQLLAMALAAASGLCTANGLLVFPIVALTALSQRNWPRAGGWVACGVGAWAWYFWGYSVADQPFAHAPFSVGSALLNAMCMAGAATSFGTVPLAVRVACGAMVLLAAIATWLAAWPKFRGAGDPAFLLFLLLTIAMTATARVGWPVAYMLQDRYRPYALLAPGVLYLIHFGRFFPGPRPALVAGAAVVLALVFNVLSYAASWPDLVLARRWAEATAMNVPLGREFPLPAAPEQAEGAARIERAAVERGNWRPPRLLSADALAAIRVLPRTNVPALAAAWTCRSFPDTGGYIVEGEPPAGAAPDFAVLFQDGEALILPLLGERLRLAEIPRRASFMGARYHFLLGGPVYRPGQHPLYAVRHGADGRIVALWSASVVCP